MNVQKHIESESELTSLQCNFCENPLSPQHLLVETYGQRNFLLDQHRAKDIDDIVESYHSPALIMCDDMLTYYEEEQCLKRLYKAEEYEAKIKMLSEYYKFHNQVPRLFMLSFAETIDNYVDEQRQLEYAKVTRILKKQQPEKKEKTKFQPIQRLIDSIDLSYEDFEKREVKKQKPIMKNRKHNNMKNLKDKFQIRSTDKVARIPLTSRGLGSNKNSQKKTVIHNPSSNPSHPSLNSNKSSKGLSRQKSKGNLQMVRKNSTKKILTIHREYGKEVKTAVQPQKVTTQNTLKPRNQSSHRNILQTARNRCDSRNLLKGAAVPLKTIDMNQFGNGKHRQSRTNLHNIVKVEDHLEPKRKISTSSRQQSKNSSKCLLNSNASNQLHSSQQSSSSNINQPTRKNVQNMFMNVLTMKKNKANCP